MERIMSDDRKEIKGRVRGGDGAVIIDDNGGGSFQLKTPSGAGVSPMLQITSDQDFQFLTEQPRAHGKSTTGLKSFVVTTPDGPTAFEGVSCFGVTSGTYQVMGMFAGTDFLLTVNGAAEEVGSGSDCVYVMPDSGAITQIYVNYNGDQDWVYSGTGTVEFHWIG